MQPGDRAGGAGDRDGGDGVPDVRCVRDHGAVVAVVDGELHSPDEGRGGGAGADGACEAAGPRCGGPGGAEGSGCGPGCSGEGPGCQQGCPGRCWVQEPWAYLK
ncbi:unnamed protein product [Linum tenue]|uniref:Uncharacterized protein n=1 Tax=Linum tenue TaxID=586396 RepID=A0AAV0K1X5_9ROSI|nr:unnamed protein product [Linum tenue]